MSVSGGDRPRLISETFVDLADTLANDYAVADLLHTLVEQSALILEADVTGVLLEDSGGELRLAAASSSEMEAIEEAEITHRQGPCVEAYRTGEAVIVEDLRDERERWPAVVPQLLDMGMASGHAFPIKLRDDRIGALNLYRYGLKPFTDEDVRLAQAFADMAAIGILQRRTVLEAEERAEQLEGALRSRIIIEQAKGVLAERHGLPPRKVFEALRAHARRTRTRIHDLSREVVEEGAEIPMD